MLNVETSAKSLVEPSKLLAHLPNMTQPSTSTAQDRESLLVKRISIRVLLDAAAIPAGNELAEQITEERRKSHRCCQP